MMISKWVVNTVTRTNPTLTQFIEDYASLNLDQLVAGKSEEEDAIGLNWDEYLAAKESFLIQFLGHFCLKSVGFKLILGVNPKCRANSAQ